MPVSPAADHGDINGDVAAQWSELGKLDLVPDGLDVQICHAVEKCKAGTTPRAWPAICSSGPRDRNGRWLSFPIRHASDAGLRYISDDGAGITRVKVGKGVGYRDVRGRPRPRCRDAGPDPQRS